MSIVAQRARMVLLIPVPLLFLGLCLCVAPSHALAQAPGRPPGVPPAMPIAQMANDLGVTPARLRAAFQKVHPAPQGWEPSEAQRREDRRVLSESLGVPPERLDAVMDKYRPGGRAGGRPERAPGVGSHPDPQDEDHGRPVALVARDLGVTPAQFTRGLSESPSRPAGSRTDPGAAAGQPKDPG